MVSLGVDIGGSKIALSGRIARRTVFAAQFRIDVETEPRAVLDEMLEYLRARIDQHGAIDSVGIASAPNLDANGVVTRWPNHPRWERTPVAAAFASLATHKILWCDDGTAATIADADALSTPNLIHLSFGTGVGGGIFFENRVLADRELGHLMVYPDGLACSCGRAGCLQAYVSARSLQHHLDGSTGGDAEVEWYEQAVTATAICVSNLVELFRSPWVTFSGGLSSRFPGLASDVDRRLQDRYLKSPLTPPRVMLSPHGSNASLQGAHLIAAGNETLQTMTCSNLWLR